MGRNDSNLARIWREIQKVLLTAWDPIGVGHVPEAQDEYDSYISGIYDLLRRGASKKEIGAHLFTIESKHMGLSNARPYHKETIDRLFDINLESNS